MAGSSVQFFGKENVLKAYNTRGIDAWGLFDRKQFIHAGSGSIELETFLDMLTPGGSNSIYTLKVYRDIDDADDITDKTECNGSFNFKLFAVNQVAPGAVMAGPGQSTDPILAKLQGVINQEVSNAIEKKLSGDRDEEDEQENWNSVIMGYVREPEKLVQVIHAIGSYFKPGAAPSYPSAVLAGANKPVQRVGAAEQDSADEKLQRLASVLDRLERADPEILDHLEQLADLAEKQPAKYKLALSFL